MAILPYCRIAVYLVGRQQTTGEQQRSTTLCLGALVPWYGVVSCRVVSCCVVRCAAKLSGCWVSFVLVFVFVFDILHMEIPGPGSQREKTNIIIAGECQPGVKRARLFCRGGQGASIVMLDCAVLAERGEG